MTKEIITILQEAKEYLFEKGWHQGDYGMINGPVCLAGACMMVEVGNFDVYSVLGDELIQVLNETVQKDGYSFIADFNDHADTTFDDVIDVIDRTIKNLENSL